MLNQLVERSPQLPVSHLSLQSVTSGVISIELYKLQTPFLLPVPLLFFLIYLFIFNFVLSEIVDGTWQEQCSAFSIHSEKVSQPHSAFAWFPWLFWIGLNVTALRMNCNMLSPLTDAYFHGGRLKAVNSCSFNFCFGYVEEENQLLFIVSSYRGLEQLV